MSRPGRCQTSLALTARLHLPCPDRGQASLASSSPRSQAGRGQASLASPGLRAAARLRSPARTTAGFTASPRPRLGWAAARSNPSLVSPGRSEFIQLARPPRGRASLQSPLPGLGHPPTSLSSESRSGPGPRKGLSCLAAVGASSFESRTLSRGLGALPGPTQSLQYNL